jgi:hypothetical protein
MKYSELTPGKKFGIFGGVVGLGLLAVYYYRRKDAIAYSKNVNITRK